MYQLRRLAGVRAQLRQVPNRIRQDVNRIINDLQDEPYPLNAEELRDHYRGIWKIKIDGWRIFYRVDKVEKTVTIIAIKRRDRNTYTSIFSILL